MKIKNLAFFGIMAAIMSVAGTARADTTTVIASQAYVDAKDALKQDNAKRIQTTKSAYDALQKTTDQKKEDYPSMYTLEDSITAIGSNNFATKNLDNLTDTGKANVSAQGTYDSEATYATGTVGKAIKDLDDTKQDNLTFDTTPTADSSNPVTSGGVKTALDDKQGNLGGSGQNGKVVTATNTAGTVTYTSIDGAVTANSTNLVTSGAVAAAIGDANSAVTNAYANNALTREGLEAASNLAKMAAVQDTIARQGSLEKAWNEEFDSTAATTANATNLYNATTNRTTNENATPDNYVPTVAAVEKRVKSAIDAATQAASTSAANTYQLKSDSNVASDGNYIDAGQGVGANLVALDTQAKANADNIATNTADIATINTTLQGKQDTLTFDATPTSDSTNPVTSGGVYTALAGKQASFSDGSQNGTGLVKTVSQNGGTVSATASLGVYVSDMNNALKGVSSNSTAACTKGSPCTLTYYKDGTNEYMRWTPMDTESTDADTTAADRSNA